MSGVDYYWASDLTDAEVNTLVARALNWPFDTDFVKSPGITQPLVEAYKITSDYIQGEWVASMPQGHDLYGVLALGTTAHAAQLRMFLLLKYGKEQPDGRL